MAHPRAPFREASSQKGSVRATSPSRRHRQVQPIGLEEATDLQSFAQTSAILRAASSGERKKTAEDDAPKPPPIPAEEYALLPRLGCTSTREYALPCPPAMGKYALPPSWHVACAKTPLERHELGVAKGLLERSAASSRIMPSTPATYGIGRPTFSLSSTDDGSTASSSHGCPGVEIGTRACALDLIVGSLKSASLDPAAAGASRPHQHACVASNSQHGSDGQSARSNGNRSSQVRAVTPFRIVTEVVIASSGSDSVQSEVMDLQAEIKSARDAFDLFEQTLDIDVCAQVISTLRSVRTRLVEQRYRDKKARETREQLEAMTPEAREAAVNELREKKRLAQQAWRAKRARTRSASSASSRSTTDAPPESSSSGSQSVQTARAHPARMVNRQSKMVPCGRGKTLVVPVSSNSGAASTSTNTSETTVSTPSVNDGESQTLVEISAPAPSSPAAPSYGQNSEFVSDSDVDWAALSEARIPLSPVVTTAVLQPLAPVVHRLPPSLTSDDASERTTLGVVGMEQTPMWSQRVLNESSSSGTSRGAHHLREQPGSPWIVRCFNRHE
ncbi:hypothetical protein QAD02_006886 [Eretmocerus hayati]|uniref:Uncharacterized protein n=1 Tax=Eretmocerus hayati TaxID=131215 RepID=A0ACC2N4J3_9HYME|nr:hypothetical protein QAD02_006886 [Eretmocerus hayati]